MKEERKEEKIREKTVQQWMPIEKFEDDGCIKLKNSKIIKILKIIPINYNLKSDLEKKAILNSYKILLKTCNFDFQILIQSNKKDLSDHIKKIEKNINKKENLKIKKIGYLYIDYINKINYSKKTSSKNFFIIISKNNKDSESINSKELSQNELKENYFKIKECLSRCGNLVEEFTSKEEIVELFDSFFNTRKNLKNK